MLPFHCVSLLLEVSHLPSVSYFSKGNKITLCSGNSRITFYGDYDCVCLYNSYSQSTTIALGVKSGIDDLTLCLQSVLQNNSLTSGIAEYLSSRAS